MTDTALRITLREYSTTKQMRVGATARILVRDFQSESCWWRDRLSLARDPFVVRQVGRDAMSVRAQGVTGFIHIGDVAVDVRPKFLARASPAGWREALWYIVTALDDATIGAPTTAATGARSSLPDLLGQILVTAIARAALEGFPRGYVEVRGMLPTLRGRIDVSRLATILTHPQELPCIYDEFSLDIPINRLLRWAALMLMGTVQSPRLARTLNDSALHFAGVSTVIPGPVQADMLRVPAQFSYLEPALQVARLLLRAESLRHDSGDEVAPGFLWNSADVFERYIGRLLALAALFRPADWDVEHTALVLGDLVEARAPDEHAHLRRHLNTYPDFRLVTGSQTIAIVDAKYKVWSPTHGPSVADVYQVMAGCRVSGCRRAVLVYPSLNGARIRPITWRVRGEGMPTLVTAMFVNLAAAYSQEGEMSVVLPFAEDLATLCA